MILKFGCVVEGDGETRAVPGLIRRIIQTIEPAAGVEVPCIRSPKSWLIRGGALEIQVEKVARKVGRNGGLIVLMDSDDSLPCQLAPELARRVQTVRPDMPSALILAEREYESWFLAAAPSIAGKHGLSVPLNQPANFQTIRDAKGWLTNQMPPGRAYKEILDQPALTAIFDMEAAKESRSFEKFHREVCRIARLLMTGV